MEQPRKPTRKTGWSHLLAASRYSAAGLRRLLQESAFRQELIVGALLLGGLVLWGVPVGRVLGLLVLFLILLAVEALNTAVEIIVDHLSPEWSEFARDAKDLGSFAVGAVLLAMAVYLVWALLL